MVLRWASVALGVLLLAGGLSSCGEDCNSPSDCDFGEACVEGACVNNDLGQACSINRDCSDPELTGATAICVSGQCQILLDRPEPSGPDAGGTDTGTTTADAGN